ncbi:MAG: deoxyribose-phosphate aldolase [Erysipelotrichaceae bacterium]|nr:deoxyribose-phosphate aldolase [Erysipelotrichaceae bacterium]
MELNKYIDHTLLKADATRKQIEKLCEEAKQYDFASVCVNSGYVSLCRKLLEGSDVKVCTVIGFPLGACTTTTKAMETKRAYENGADEFDMVINIGQLKDGNLDFIVDDISAVVQQAQGKTVKVIIETCLLTDTEKLAACKCAVAAGADFVKTSTGFSTGGATVEDVALMRNAVKESCKVKASGGIRTYEDAMKMIEAGADRLGCSAGVRIMEEYQQQK